MKARKVSMSMETETDAPKKDLEMATNWKYTGPGSVSLTERPKATIVQPVKTKKGG